MKNGLKNSLCGVVAFALSSAVAVADPLDYSSITDAVDVTTVAAAIVAIAVLKVGPNVAAWASRKLAGFFR